jgi:hypothetical protein
MANVAPEAATYKDSCRAVLSHDGGVGLKTNYCGNVNQQVRLLAVLPPEDQANDGAEAGGA